MSPGLIHPVLTQKVRMASLRPLSAHLAFYMQLENTSDDKQAFSSPSVHLRGLSRVTIAQKCSTTTSDIRHRVNEQCTNIQRYHINVQY
jgi:hypothetical protein